MNEKVKYQGNVKCYMITKNKRKVTNKPKKSNILRKGETMNCETSNEEQKNDVTINRGQTIWRNIKKSYRNVEHFLNKQKYIREVMLALSISLMVFIVFLIQTFHDAEEFENTEIGEQLIYEQEELVKEYNIIPYLDTILSETNEDSIAPYFRERGFLDPNYQYKILMGNKSFKVFS